MTRELIIPFKDRIPPKGVPTRKFDFYDKNGTLTPLHKLTGKTTTWPGWVYGVTREIDGKTWWLIQETSMDVRGGFKWSSYDEENKFTGEVLTASYSASIQNYTTVEQRAIFRLTDVEAKILGRDTVTASLKMRGEPVLAFGVREDSKAWDLWMGELPLNQHMDLPVGLTVKLFADKITWWDTVELPRLKELKIASEQANKLRAITFLDMPTLPLPRIQRGRGGDNSVYNVTKVVNAQSHNIMAIIQRLKEKGLI